MIAGEDYRSIARRLLHHAWPVLVAQLLSMSMMVADTLIAGRHSTADLAAVAIGSGLYVSVVMLLVGVLQAVAPTVAHHVGAGRRSAIGPALQQGLWLAGFLALPGTLLLAYPQSLLNLARVPPELAGMVADYLHATAFGLPAVLLYRTLYAFNNAVGRPRALMVISLVAASIHVPLAWSLTTGHFSSVPLGGMGCGISTAVVGWVSLSCGVCHLVRNPAYREYRIFAHWQAPQWRALAALLRLGIPMGLSTFIEITSFTLIALFVARLGAEAVAGHRIVSNIAALVYMLPLAMSTATLVLVGQAAGAHDWAAARRYVRVGLFITTGMTGLVGVALWLGRSPIIGVSTRDGAAYGVALALLPYICIYQVFDAAQTVAAHALRGFKVTLLPMVMHTLCFWGLGLGLGYWLSFEAGPRAAAPSVAGFWEGGVLATITASVLFGGLLRAAIRRQPGIMSG